jgi:hypothetical protein
MTPTDQVKMALELGTALSQLSGSREALDRFTDLARIHNLEGRNTLYFANYHLREAAALLEKIGTPAPKPQAIEVPALPYPPEEISSASEEQTETVIKSSDDNSGAGDSQSDSQAQ